MALRATVGELSTLFWLAAILLMYVLEWKLLSPGVTFTQEFGMLFVRVNETILLYATYLSI